MKVDVMTKQIPYVHIIVVIFMLTLVGYAYFLAHLGVYVFFAMVSAVLASGLVSARNGVKKILSAQLVLLTGFVIAIAISAMHKQSSFDGPFDFLYSLNYLGSFLIVTLSIIGSVIAGSKSKDDRK